MLIWRRRGKGSWLSQEFRLPYGKVLLQLPLFPLQLKHMFTPLRMVTLMYLLLSSPPPHQRRTTTRNLCKDLDGTDLLPIHTHPNKLHTTAMTVLIRLLHHSLNHLIFELNLMQFRHHLNHAPMVPLLPLLLRSAKTIADGMMHP